ncbi:ankyrin repeat domain-containing protein 10-like [Actinia tenebrosa]|uniref:Ankyrin repeat domain-containing protein 10-like n=1 Tax=Actinia tenebrosa TaxID=6105 RepID=A0A6P8I2U1_ACTTE|nr:ankyrin repeat domain-containing protein 10-like [Actinia tenebrosa]
MGSENCFMTKEHLNERILRSPWSEYPLPPLHRACRDGDVQSLLYLVIQGDRLEVFRCVNEKDQFLMWTPAHWAAYFGHLECLMRLVSCGLSLDVMDGRLKQTTLHLAAFAGNALVLDWILHAGASIDKQDSLGETAVHKAVRGDSVECLEVLQKYKAPMNMPNSSQQTPYEIALSLKGQCIEYFRVVLDLKYSAGPISRSGKRSLDDDDDLENSAKKSRNDSDHLAINQNGFHTPIHNDQEILSMMEANGQYPLIEKRESSPFNRQLNGTVNGERNEHMNGDCDMQEDHSSNGQNALHTESTYFTQSPIRCLTLCGHLQ